MDKYPVDISEQQIEAHELALESLEARTPTLDALHILWDQRAYLRKIVLRGVVVVTVIVLLIPAKYESSTRLMPPDPQLSSGLSMLASLAKGSGSGSSMSSLPLEMLGMKTSGALFADMVTGRTIQDHIIDRFDLQKVYWDRTKDDARKTLSKYTDVSEDRKSGVITITVTDRNRQRASQIAQAYVDELDKLVAQVSTSSARRERQFIEQRLESVKRDLETAEKEFSQFSSTNTTLDIRDQGKAMLEAAATLQGEEIAAKSELEALEQIYTPNNIRVRSAQAKLAELQRKEKEFSGADQSGDGTIGSYPSVRQLPIVGAKWADLYRKVKVQETLYEMLRQNYELARIQEAKEIPVVRVLDAPNVPEKKSSPPRVALLVLGFLSWLSIAVAYVLGRQHWNSLSPSDPRRIFWDRLSSDIASSPKTKRTVRFMKSLSLRRYRHSNVPR